MFGQHGRRPPRRRYPNTRERASAKSTTAERATARTRRRQKDEREHAVKREQATAGGILASEARSERSEVTGRRKPEARKRATG